MSSIRLVLLAASALASALLSVSCQRQDDIISSADPEFIATIPDTKTIINTDPESVGAGKVSWEMSDIIVLTGVAGVQSRYGVKEIFENGSARFVKKNKEPSVGSGPYTALYGAESLEDQLYSDYAGGLPMIAQSPTTKLNFNTTCGLLKVYLENEGTLISRISAVNTNEETFSLRCPTPVDITDGAWFYLALPEGQYREFVFLDTKGKACIKKAKDGKETGIVKNRISSISFTSTLSFVYALDCFEAQVGKDGSLNIDQCGIGISCKIGNNACTVSSSIEDSSDPKRYYTITGPDKKKYFSGYGLWSQLSADAVHGELSVSCELGVAVAELCPKISIAHADYPNAAWSANGTTYRLGQSGFFSGATTDCFTLEFSEGRSIIFKFKNPVEVKVRNGTAATGLWYIKFGMCNGEGQFNAGDTMELSFDISSDSDIRLNQFASYEIGRSSSWSVLENLKDIEPGSALDFSLMGLQDAPAGKYGWLKAVTGGFEFEGRPGVPQIFCGANLCSSSNFISHELADKLAARFAAIGYNAVRIHHHDKNLKDPGNWDNLDYLLSKFFEHGIYVTTDLYVSRNVRYSTLGLEGSGYMTKNLYKNLVACYEPAFKDWCAFAKEFLEHVNPYTGRAYKDEPGIPLISLINEGRLNGCGEKGCPPIQQEWEKYGGQGQLAWNSPGFGEFEEYLSRKVFEKCSAYVLSLGVKALLTNDNNGLHHGDMEGNTPLYDYVDNHFYIDYPSALEGSYAVPATCTNVNLVYEGGPEMLRRDYVRTAQKPYTITEWNWCGPNRYRGMSGLMIGAMAAAGGWDGIWRFAYSHIAADVGTNPDSYPSAVNLATDPLNLASERATVCLYLRKDSGSPEDLSMNSADGSMKVVTDRTCGFFIHKGHETAGALEATVSGAPASIWVSSLDSNPIETSGRMLLVHATDVQGENIRYGDSSRKMILKWGKGTVVENGSADVSISVGSPSGYKVYELATDGHRVREITSGVSGGKLSFTVSTDGPSGGRIYYEIVKP